MCLGELGDLGGETRVERIADDGGRVEQEALLGLEGLQLARQGGGDRGRDRSIRSRCAAAGAGVHARELLEVEGIAAGLLVDRARALPDQLGRLGLAERRQDQPRHAVLGRRGGQRRGHRGRSLSLARREGEEDRRARRPAHQRREGVDRCRIGPMDVVQAENERAGAGETLEEIAQRAVRAVPVTWRRCVREAGQCREHPAERTPIGQAEARQPALAGGGEVRVQRLRPQRVGQVRLELGGPRMQHRAAVRGGGRRQVGEQERLADARLALDGDHRTGPRAQRPQRAGDRVALPSAPYDQRR